MTSLPPSRSDPSKAINTSPTWDLWQFCQVCRPGNTALWPRPSPYRWPPGETLGACPQGNGDGTRPKGLGHPAEGQGVNCPPLSPSRLRSSSGVEWLNQIFLSPPCLSFDGFPENQNKISTKHAFFLALSLAQLSPSWPAAMGWFGQDNPKSESESLARIRINQNEISTNFKKFLSTQPPSHRPVYWVRLPELKIPQQWVYEGPEVPQSSFYAF